MPTHAKSKLAEFEAAMRTRFNLAADEEWQTRLPENGHGDRLFAEWQRLAIAARKEEEHQ